MKEDRTKAPFALSDVHVGRREFWSPSMRHRLTKAPLEIYGRSSSRRIQLDLYSKRYACLQVRTLIDEHEALLDEITIGELRQKFLQEKDSKFSPPADDTIRINILLKPKILTRAEGRALEEQRVCLL